MRLTFLGSGDAFGTGGRFNTCFHVATASTRFLIDCGASSLVAMRRFGVDPKEIDAIFITHLHGDHFGGLPFVILDAQFVCRRTAPLVVVGPPGLRQRLHDAMEVLYPGSAKIQRGFSIETIEITPGRAHQVGTVSVTPFIAAHESGAPSFALRFACDGKVVVYSGDTGWIDTLKDASADADLLIVECSSFDKAIPGHIDYGTLRAHRHELGAKRVIITHMGPEMLAQAEAGRVEMETAHDGKQVEI